MICFPGPVPVEPGMTPKCKKRRLNLKGLASMMTVKQLQKYVNSPKYKKEVEKERRKKEQESDLYFEKLGDILENSCPPHRVGLRG